MQDEKSIDIVYLWVDGNDPVWRAKRDLAVAKLSLDQRHAMALYGNVEGRFRDNDELRYNLRALERFFPSHGHIYIVTDAQTPAWLRPSNGLTLIDHRELMPPASLPTFDSSHIESYIHRIPGLSAQYFYLNDDVFFGAPVALSDWFLDSGIYVAWSDEPVVTDEPLREDALSLENACRLSSQWFRAAAHQPGLADYQHTFRTFAHSPRPMHKAVLFELEQRAPSLFERVRSTVFRTWDKPTIISDFVMRWALAQGLAKTRHYSSRYLSTGEADQAVQLDDLMAALGTLDFFCLNDTTDDAHAQDPRLIQVRAALQAMFSQASRFEQLPDSDASAQSRLSDTVAQP